jgi:hypothetical protein
LRGAIGRVEAWERALKRVISAWLVGELADEHVVDGIAQLLSWCLLLQLAQPRRITTNKSLAISLWCRIIEYLVLQQTKSKP